MKFTYLLIDFFTILVPFIFSFHPRLNFFRTWSALFPALIISGLIFIGWDMYFTAIKVWGFNRAYVTGFFIGNLPIEEILFFFCIPYSCVFTFYCLGQLIKKTFSKKAEFTISIILILVSVIIAVIYHAHQYTAVTFTLLPVLLFTAQFVMKVTWLPEFYITYIILLLPFLIVNGLLTGTGLHSPVVWYNNAQTLRYRIFTIPVEDIFYGMDLILLNILIYVNFNRKVLNNFKSAKIAEPVFKHDKS